MSIGQVLLGTILVFLGGIALGVSVGMMWMVTPDHPVARKLVPTFLAAGAVLFVVAMPIWAAGLQ